MATYAGLSRRRFLAGTLGAGGLGALVACGTQVSQLQGAPYATNEVRNTGSAPAPASTRSGTTSVASGSAVATMDHSTIVPSAGTATPAKDWKMMNQMHEAGVKTFLAQPKTRCGGQPMPFTMQDGIKVFDVTAKKVAVGGHARPDGRGVHLQRRRPRPGDPRHRGRQGARPPHERPGRRGDGDPLPRPADPERDGRRPLHHPAAGQSRRDVHLRLRGPQSRLAHVPLAPQQRLPGDEGAAWRVHHRAEGQEHVPGIRQGIHDDPRRRPAGLHAERPRLPGDGGAHGEARARSCWCGS